MTQTFGTTISILLVEDSPEDRAATLRALQKIHFPHSIHTCNDGDDALDYLFHRGEYSDPNRWPRPALILLDLNLPNTSGEEVLLELKKDATLRKIPVIVLTTSANPRDVDACYSAGANSFVTKPVEFAAFRDLLSRIMEHWLQDVILPNTTDIKLTW